jgi:FkbM family methyltransferase
MNINSHIKLREVHPNFRHVNENTEASIKYTATNGSTHNIHFTNLLKKGYNMDKWIKEGTLFKRPDHNYAPIVRLLKQNSVVYDLGAYIGTFAIPMAIEGMKVYTFEAWPANHVRCVENCAPYDIENFCVALSNENKTKKSQITHCQGWANFDENHFEEIRHARLDDFIREKQLPLPSLIKMDIEGMESIAMHGMTDLLENVRPIWSVGYHFKMPLEVEGVAWTEPEDGGYDFSNISKLDYLIYNERGRQVPASILRKRGGEFTFIPRERIKQ